MRFRGPGRALIADPFFMKKAAKGDVVGIRKCIGCMYCREQLYAQLPVKCALNPRVGYESTYPLVPEQDGAGRVVAVIGGGPAGMQSAVTLGKARLRCDAVREGRYPGRHHELS